MILFQLVARSGFHEERTVSKKFVVVETCNAVTKFIVQIIEEEAERNSKNIKYL